MTSEIRVSPDGRNVAIRNLHEVSPQYSGDYAWRASNGAYLTDAQVADWIVLQPGPAVLVDVFYNPADSETKHADGEAVYDVEVNGNKGPRRVSQFIAGAFITSAALQKLGEPVMVRALPRTAPVAPLAKAPLRIVGTDTGL